MRMEEPLAGNWYAARLTVHMVGLSDHCTSLSAAIKMSITIPGFDEPWGPSVFWGDVRGFCSGANSGGVWHQWHEINAVGRLRMA